MLENKLTELFFSQVTEQNKKKTVSGITVSYLALIGIGLGWGLNSQDKILDNQQLFNIRQQRIDSTVNAMSWNQRDISEYKSFDIQEHSKMMNRQDKFEERLTRVENYGSPITDQRLTNLEVHDFGYSRSTYKQ